MAEHPRIKANGALCDRCNTALTPYYTHEQFVCIACMSQEEKTRFNTKQEKTQ